MNVTDEEFPALFGIVAGALHQDIDLEYDTAAQALAGYARATKCFEKQMLLSETERFLERYHNDLDGEFARRFGFNFTPKSIGYTVPELFDMLRTILDDPESYMRFEPRN
ncbi:cytosine/adenosine deaminase-related metal-dependent hydrolase [Rhizobium skierniewicense]|uniref:Cytosine/adenosine deaminase-related metal-dependent hydrolase n=1 Tax=Rhizobium skierniewicense TaxID=984260 RepID=A0A7W6CA43_9HYPH|nr:contact-dependent growth inhibition system immunity protein [Rhizobium skierniewicense]MBB3947274.1 cytosine/adenosine deaminase-related metal-dependent hydrolase [Rhizobium skierniewicense]